MKLSVRISLVFVPLIVVTAVNVAALLYWQVNQSLIAAGGTALGLDLDRRVAVLESSLDAVGHDVRSLARTPPILGLSRARANGGVDPLDGSTEAMWIDRLETIFEGVVATHETYAQVRLIELGPEGRELVRVDAVGKGGTLRIPSDQLQVKGGEPYMVEASAHPADAVRYSLFTLNREHGVIELPHRPMLRVVLPVSDHEGAPYAAVVINLEAQEILDEATATGGLGALHSVADQHFQWLAHPDTGREFEFEWQDPDHAAAEYPALFEDPHNEVPIRDADTRSVLVLRRVEIDDQVHVYLVGEAPYETLTAATSRAPLTALYVVPVLVGIAILLAIWSSRLTTRPLARLTEAVRDFDPDAPVDLPEGLPGEAGELADVVHRAVEELQQRERKLQQSNAELERYAFVASHDLKEPLRTITIYTELLADEYDHVYDDDAKESVSYITAATARMRRLIDDLLAHSRAGHGSTAEDTDLNVLVQDVLEDLEGPLRASGGQVEVRFLPTLHVYQSATRVIFLNLIRNAVRYAVPGAPPKIRIDAEQEAPDLWRFHVRDEGIGIPADQRERVFGLFVRLHGNDSPHGEGHGLGLAQVRRAVQLHDGSIEARAPDGPGAWITFTLREVRT